MCVLSGERVGTELLDQTLDFTCEGVYGTRNEAHISCMQSMNFTIKPPRLYAVCQQRLFFLSFC